MQEHADSMSWEQGGAVNVNVPSAAGRQNIVTLGPPVPTNMAMAANFHKPWLVLTAMYV